MPLNIKVNVDTYSTSVKSAVAQNVSKDIANAIKESPELRKEIARTFQMANRRIQNLQSKSDVISPALAALGERATIDGFSKFRIGAFGHTDSDWEQLKREYSEAVAFLQQPTSTVTGARQFEKHVKDGLFAGADSLSEEGKQIFWEKIKDNVINGFNDVAPQMLGAMRYQDIMQEVYDRAVDDTASLIERLAIQTADELEDKINADAYRIAVEAFSTVDDYVKNAFNTFNKF